MKASLLLKPAYGVIGPPPGSANVLRGDPIDGPGGRWVPCVTRTVDGKLMSAIFEVGQGRRQVCVALPVSTQDEALNRAIDLALVASA
jgi:hypothetical protein